MLDNEETTIVPEPERNLKKNRNYDTFIMCSTVNLRDRGMHNVLKNSKTL